MDIASSCEVEDCRAFRPINLHVRLTTRDWKCDVNKVIQRDASRVTEVAGLRRVIAEAILSEAEDGRSAAMFVCRTLVMLLSPPI
jgi:hypothetical protein